MRKLWNWVIAATLICGSSAIASCTNDVNDNPAQEQAKQDRKEFVQHTRAALKSLAENTNYSSWEAANTLNMNFNQYVLLNKELKNTLVWPFIQMMMTGTKPVEEGSELAKMGYKTCMTMDLSNLKTQLTMDDDNKEFTQHQADNFEIILNGWNPQTQQMEKGIYKLTMNISGESGRRIFSVKGTDGGAVILIIPSDIQFTMSSKITGTWNDDFSGTISYKLPEGATDNSKGYALNATVNSNILPGTLGSYGDKTQLTLAVNSDRVSGQADVELSYTQNDRKIMDMSLKESGANMGGLSNFDLSQFSSSSSSIFEAIGAILSTRSIDEGKLTLFDDLTTTFSVSNLKDLLVLESEYRADGRHYADKQTIDEYTQKLNDMVKMQITCKGINQTIPMRLVNTKVGVDYWPLYGFKFADEKDYVSLKEILDPESMEYFINVVDHSVDPIQQSVIVVRQLFQFTQVITDLLKGVGKQLEEKGQVQQ